MPKNLQSGSIRIARERVQSGAVTSIALLQALFGRITQTIRDEYSLPEPDVSSNSALAGQQVLQRIFAPCK